MGKREEALRRHPDSALAMILEKFDVGIDHQANSSANLVFGSQPS